MKARRSFAIAVTAAAVGLLTQLVGPAAAVANEGSSRSGALHVTKECSEYTGEPGSFCTVTSSNVRPIQPGMRIVYKEAIDPVTSAIDTDIVVSFRRGDYAEDRPRHPRSGRSQARSPSMAEPASSASSTPERTSHIPARSIAPGTALPQLPQVKQEVVQAAKPARLLLRRARCSADPHRVGTGCDRPLCNDRRMPELRRFAPRGSRRRVAAYRQGRGLPRRG